MMNKENLEAYKNLPNLTHSFCYKILSIGTQALTIVFKFYVVFIQNRDNLLIKQTKKCQTKISLTFHGY